MATLLAYHDHSYMASEKPIVDCMAVVFLIVVVLLLTLGAVAKVVIDHDQEEDDRWH